MKEIAYIPLCPLGDVICCMNQLEHLKRLYSPCRLTVFAIPLIGELLRNYQPVDEVVVLKGDLHGNIDLTHFTPPAVTYDILINMSYYPDGLRLQKQLRYMVSYGGESYYLTKELCQKYFTRWVSAEYWENVTLKKYQGACGQLGENLRLLDPTFHCTVPTIAPGSYHLETCSVPLPPNMVLLLPGTSAISKYWPIQKYLAIAKCLKKLGKSPVFVIGPQERILLPALEKSREIVLDTLPLAQLADAFCHADLIIGNDSGPMHLAAALQRPTIHIFAGSATYSWYFYPEPMHTLITPQCSSREKCKACSQSCIGSISVIQVLEVVCRRLHLPMPSIHQVAYLVQDRIGDSLVEISSIEALATVYAPCRTTVFATRGMLSFFQNYAFADECILLDGEKTKVQEIHFDAVFNRRYDAESVQVLRRMDYQFGYGYENIDIPEKICKEIYTGGYLPLRMWDDVKLRRYTSVTEQGASLIRLVEPDFHCQHPTLAENTLRIDFSKVCSLHQPRKSVLIVPGGSYQSKCWDIEHYVKLAEKVIAPNGFTPFFLLGPQEERYIPLLQKKEMPFALSATLEEIAGLAIQWMAYRTLALGNDTGVMHLLKIIGCRTITLSAQDSHFTWEPYESPQHVAFYPSCSSVEQCAHCYDDQCIEKISYDEVAEILAQTLKVLAEKYR